MKLGQHCAIACERVGAHEPEHFGDHIIKIQELPGTLFLTRHSFNSVDYLTGSLAIRDDILKDFAHFLAAEALAFQETQGSPSVGHNRAQRLTQLVRQRPGHFSHNRDAAQVREFFAVLSCFRFGLLALSDVHYDRREKCGRVSTGRNKDSANIRPYCTAIFAQVALLDTVNLAPPFSGFCYPCFGSGTVFLKGQLQRGESLKFLFRVAEHFLKS